MLRAGSKARERILVMGSWGSGKTQAWADIAKVSRETKSNAKFYVIDTDYAAERSLQQYDGWESNVEVAVVETWDDYVKAGKEFRSKATSDDWLVIDMLDKAWPAVQASFVEKAFGVEIDEWFLSFKRDNKSGHALAGEYGTNWSVINKMYQGFVQEMLRFPGHVIACAKADQVQQPNRDGKGGDSDEIRHAFGKFGLKPGGQKDTGFLFHTVLLLGEPQPGRWIYTTIRDRSREQMKAKEVKSFAMNYLVQVGGWKL